MNARFALPLATVGAVLAVAPAASADYASTVASTPGLSSYWRLGESSGAIAVDAQRRLNGIYMNGARLGQLPAPRDSTNPSAGFNGTGAAVTFGDQHDFPSRAAFSFEGWVRPGTAGAADSWRRVISKEASDAAHSGYSVIIAPDTAAVAKRQRIAFERKSSTGVDSVIGTTALRADVWHHVATTYDGSTMRLYVNGQLEGSTASTRSLPDTPSHLRLAVSSQGYSAYNGLLDDVAAYTVALSGAAVQAHYTAGVTTPPPTEPPEPPEPPVAPVLALAGPRPVDRTPTGTVRSVSPGQSWAAAVNASSSGDTVVVQAGSHGAQTINRAMAAGQNVNLYAAAGATVNVAGLDLTNAKGLTVKGFNTGNVYLRNSERVVVQGNVINTSSGTDGVDVRDGSNEISILDNRYVGNYLFVYLQAASDATRPTNIRIENNDSGPVSRDHIFISRGRYVHIQRNRIRGILDSPEHTDGVQSVGGQDLYIRRNHFSDTKAMRDGASDRNDHAIMLNSEPSTARYTQNVEMSNNLIHDWVGTGIAVAGGPGLSIASNTIYDLGRNGTGASAIVLDADGGNTVNGALFSNVLSSLSVGGATLTRNEANFVANGSGPAGTARSTGAPGFLNQAGSDYGLTSASSSSDSGSAAGAPADDLFGVKRQARPDRGAIELTG